MTADRKAKAPRASEGPSFPVFVRQNIGNVTTGFGVEPAAVAAFALIDSHVARNGEDASFTFALPNGPTYNVEATFGA